MQSVFPTHKLARDAGWFSRRHRTDEANREARERYKATRGREARRLRAAVRGAHVDPLVPPQP